ncbi:AAA family ATPase [Peribacillus frigoritolerans]|uniref:AAA family ATPase n=1 Tax=Peribacillus frigoritolerans TaxID=450367 RepID=UPI0034E09AEF
MYISNIKMRNFRLLNDTVLDLKKDLSLLIGRNNSGKTSFLVLFEKFYNNGGFNYNDFSLSLRKKLNNINEDTDINEFSIRMVLEIEYNEEDNLEYLSEFILDLDPDVNTVKIAFECAIDKKNLLKDLINIDKNDVENYIMKNINRYLQESIYVFENDKDLENDGRHKLIKKDINVVKKIINFQIIHAKRNVSSSEENKIGKKILSSLTTKYFNSKNKSSNDLFGDINKLIIKMDNSLDATYENFFGTFLQKSKEFLDLKNLKVISNLQSKELLEYSSQVVYGFDNNHLPEHLNGLGFMNILYLLLQIEISKDNFHNDKKDINLLFIEEPEAHTHPQMQYIFAREIEKILKGINSLQTVITTHSSHIVSQCDFENIRYMKKKEDNDGFENTEIRNFHTALSEKYKSEEEFKFVKQYLTIQSAELFFANKIIFIEGTTEKMLLPYFINKFDKEMMAKDLSYIPLSSQNITILEVGANAKAFHAFLDFLEIKTLIITDIDTTRMVENEKGKERYNACEVSQAQNTSNSTIKFYLKAPEGITSTLFVDWLKNLISGSLEDYSDSIKVVYQTEEKNYHGRSFEDAFININIETIKKKKDILQGLKNKGKIDVINDIYELTEKILDKKSDFASSLLYLSLADEEVEWEIPSYIRGGLSWIAK